MVRLIVAFFILPVGLALAQDGPKPDQLKRMYDDALVQLRSAQDRKNELANENETLKGKIAELTKQMDAGRVELIRLQVDAAAFAERTYTMRARLAAWTEFMKRDAAIQERWNVFMEKAVPIVGAAEGILDWDWPVSALGG